MTSVKKFINKWKGGDKICKGPQKRSKHSALVSLRIRVLSLLWKQAVVHRLLTKWFFAQPKTL